MGGSVLPPPWRTERGFARRLPFEGASLIHDLNLPIDESLKERFSVVFDGGTLEHIFNVPQALRNCIEMLREGGTFIQHSPANNFMGHGFYQFSPELIYQVFSKSNGFEVVALLLQESVRGGRWYTVANPAEAGRRVQMTNRLPTTICTIARRVALVPILQTVPQQTDYAMGWQKTGVRSGGISPGLRVAKPVRQNHAAISSGASATLPAVHVYPGARGTTGLLSTPGCSPACPGQCLEGG
jgi:hypothetical protein